METYNNKKIGSNKKLRVSPNNCPIGSKWNRLTVIGYGRDNDKRGTVIRICRCDCGNICNARPDQLKAGIKVSCGCYRKEMQEAGPCLKHGHNRKGKTTYLYRLWQNEKRVCYNPRSKHYKNYGGRGIIMWPEWKSSAEAFIQYIITNLGQRPSKKHSIDRINNDGNYEPGNIRWATRSEQARNRRPKSPQHKQNLSKANTGKMLPEEQKLKISEGLLKAYAEGRRVPTGVAAR